MPPQIQRLYDITQKMQKEIKTNLLPKQVLGILKNGKKMWDMINKINGKIKDKSCVIGHLKIENIKLYTGKEISNQFAKYFSNVGKVCTEN